LDCFVDDLLLLSKTGHNDFLIIEPYSIGDVVHTLAFITEFKRNYCKDGQRVNLICNKRCVPVAKLFNNIDNVIGIDCNNYEIQFESIASNFGVLSTHIPIIMSPDMYLSEKLSRLVRGNKINLLQVKPLILGLDTNAIPEVPQFDPRIFEICVQRAQIIGLKSDSLIIFNHANGIKSLNPNAYIGLRDKFGDNIYFDMNMDRELIPKWAKSIKIDLEYIPYYVEIAGAALSLRSGITDILSMCKVNIYTIYPNSTMFKKFHGVPSDLVNLYRESTLSNLKLGNYKLEKPIFLYDEDTFISTVSKLNSAFN
jgi:hypothetical protein